MVAEVSAIRDDLASMSLLSIRAQKRVAAEAAADSEVCALRLRFHLQHAAAVTNCQRFPRPRRNASLALCGAALSSCWQQYLLCRAVFFR
jgi:hypothetical protein